MHTAPVDPMAQLQEQVNTLTLQLQNYEALYAEAQASMNEARDELDTERKYKSVGRTKIAAPPSFTGKMNETKLFIQACQIYLLIRKDEFQDEESKILWVLSYMQGGSALKY